MSSANFKYLIQNHLLQNFADQEEDVVDSSESNLLYLDDVSAKGFRAQRRRNSFFAPHCLQVSVLSLLIFTILLIFLLFRKHNVDQRACIIKQSIYCGSARSTVISPNQIFSRQTYHGYQAHAYSTAPVLDVLSDDYQDWKFNGTFRDFSPYKGPPSADVDKAWNDLFACT